MLPILRDYQGPMVQSGLDFFLSKRIKVPKLMVAPTASGKSIIIAAIAAGLPGKILVIQPSKELLRQNFNKYLKYDQNCSAFSASFGKRQLAKVTFATIGTIVSCPELFIDFEFMIIDEAHLYPARDESMFGSFRLKNPQMKILGLTATPFRLISYRNSARLGMMHNEGIFNGYQHVIQIKDICEKYWAPIQYISEKGNTKLLKINSTGAEFTDDSIALYGKSVEKNLGIALQKFWDMPALIFMPSVAEAYEWYLKTPDSGFVCGKKTITIKGKTYPVPDRDKTIADFLSGKIKRIFNFGVLSVGFDFPGLMVIIDLLATLSLAKHYQKYGRLTRLHPDDPRTVKYYIDFAGNTERFGRMEDLEMRAVGTTFQFFSKDRQITNVNLADLAVNEPPKMQVIQLPIQNMFEDMVLPFGMHKGKKISDVPKGWLSWAADNLNESPIRKNIRLFINQQKEREAQERMRVSGV